MSKLKLATICEERSGRVTQMLLYLIPTYISIALVLEDNLTSEFGDLGKLLLAGVLVAIFFAVTFTIVRMRLRDKNPRAPDFISIKTASHSDEQEAAKQTTR
ncbi:MAG TPA: hypothetical protein VIV66_16255 [Pyrinomonadaceae bacterium]